MFHARHEHRWDFCDIPPIGAPVIVRLLKSRLLDAVEHEARFEAGIEQHAERSIEIVLSDRLVLHRHAFRRLRTRVLRNADGIPGQQGSCVGRLFFSHECDAARVEAWVTDREHKPRDGLQQLMESGEHWFDAGHVHHRHRASRSIEPLLAKRQQRHVVGGVDHLVLDLSIVFGGVRLRVLDHSRGSIEGHDMSSERGHSSCELAVAAADVEHELSRPKI